MTPMHSKTPTEKSICGSSLKAIPLWMEVDIRPLIDEAMIVWGATAWKQGVELQLIFPFEKLMLWTSPINLFRTLHYLVAKAILQSVEGSKVEVSIQVDSNGVHQHSSKLISFQVRDWAGGITEYDSKEVLDLCSPKTINAFVDISSHPGRGTTYQLHVLGKSLDHWLRRLESESKMYIVGRGEGLSTNNSCCVPVMECILQNVLGKHGFFMPLADNAYLFATKRDFDSESWIAELGQYCRSIGESIEIIAKSSLSIDYAGTVETILGRVKKATEVPLIIEQPTSSDGVPVSRRTDEMLSDDKLISRKDDGQSMDKIHLRADEGEPIRMKPRRRTTVLNPTVI